MLDDKFFQKVGPDISACFRRYIFGSADDGKSARDIHGKPYKGYSTNPSKWASIQMKKSARGLIPKEGISYADAKKTGQMQRQASHFKDSTAPVLSTDLLRDMRFYGTFAGGFGFGALSARGKIKHLAKMGRVIATKQKALPDKCAKKIMKEADKYVMKIFGKIKGRTFNI
tara:strand:- start:48 stop:560 length:513 start_codon:yes stop_codon:yes gene_type:complete